MYILVGPTYLIGHLFFRKCPQLAHVFNVSYFEDGPQINSMFDEKPMFNWRGAMFN